MSWYGALALGPVVGVPAEAGDGEIEPQAGIVIGKRKRLTKERRSAVVIAAVVGLGALVAERLIRGAGRREEAALDRAGELARLVDIAAGDEVELREARRLEARGQLYGLDKASGGRAGGGVQRAEVGLEEAPAGLVVVGEGAALVAGNAGRLAGVEVDVLDGLVVEAGIVGVGRDDDAGRLLLRQRPAHGEAGCKQDAENQKTSRVDDVAHGFPPTGARPRGPDAADFSRRQRPGKAVPVAATPASVRSQPSLGFGLACRPG